MSSEPLYRVIFTQEDEVYEIYAKYLSEDTLMGFIEVEELLFGEETTLVVDPSEEKLRNEFKGVKRTYIPLHLLLRIDEVHKEGAAKIKPTGEKNNVHHFAHYTKSGYRKSDS